MYIPGSVQDLLARAEQPLNIIEEFAALNPKRKMLLCDHLFSESFSTFTNTVKLLWPEARDKDVKKLQKFLEVLRAAAH